MNKSKSRVKERPLPTKLLRDVSLAVAICLVTVTMFPALAAAGAQQSLELAKQVMTRTAVAIGTDNSEQQPLTITYAGVKVVTGDEYIQLTGGAGNSDHYVSFPRLELSNNSAKKITEFHLLIEDKRNPTRRMGLIVHNHPIEPLSTRRFRPELWTPSQKALKSSSEGTQDISRAATWSSSVMWTPGNPSGFVIMVSSVTYEDGSGWKIGG